LRSLVGLLVRPIACAHGRLESPATLQNVFMKTSKTKSTTRNRVNVGVVGLGFMGVMHIRAYQQIRGARLVAVCDPVRQPVDGVLTDPGGNVGDAAPVKLDMKQVQAYRNLDDLLADSNVDLVDICVPTHLHPPAATAALKSGKHVLCEKPLARTVALARDIVTAAADAKGFFMPAMCMRFWPGWSWLKSAIDEKTYGQVLAARFRRIAEPPGWGRENYFKGAQSGGALLDLHIHDTDFVQFCFGRPRSVFSSGLSKFSGAIDHVVTQYQFDSGVPVCAEGSWLVAPGGGFNMAYTLHFENAMADYDLARGPEALKLFVRGKPCRVITCKGPDGYVRELQHMVECIKNGEAPAVVTARDGLDAVEICEAEERSVQTGQVVKVGGR
jgi:predicted dehydrogenase